MKIQQALLTELIKKLLPHVELVDEGHDENVNVDALLAAIDEARHPIIESKVKDDLHKHITGKTAGALKRVLIRQTGAKEADLEAAKSDEDAIRIALEFKAKQLGEGAEKTEATIQELVANHAKELEAIKNEYGSKLNEATSKYHKKEIISHITKELSKVNVSPKADLNKVANLVYAELSANADLAYNENDGTVSVYQKGTQTPALSKAGNNLFSWQESLTDIVSPLGIISTSTAEENPNKYKPKDLGGDFGGGSADLSSLEEFNKMVAAQLENI